MSKRTVELDVATPGVDARGEPVRLPLTMAEAPQPAEPDMGGEHLLINLGPQHPATHGVLRLVVELDGETVVRVIPHLGYLHSGFEKLGEYRHYNQIIPLTDRTDYLSPMANNVALAMAAEKLMGIAITPRCTVLRVIACEMSRIISHMVWLGTTAIDLGAFTPFLWAFQERERIYNLQEMWTGARLTTSLTRVGGMMADIPDGFVEGLRHFTKTYPKTLNEIDRILTRNAIWAGRTQGIGVMTAAEAINYSLSGPMLRASGVPWDMRKDQPYLDYETYDFEVPVGEHGDVYDRYLVRLEECYQSNRILEQALDRLSDALKGRPNSRWRSAMRRIAFSTITTAPVTSSPKSTAPRLMRFADMLKNLMPTASASMEKGIASDTRTAARALPRMSRRTTTTRAAPVARFSPTVLMVALTR